MKMCRLLLSFAFVATPAFAHAQDASNALSKDVKGMYDGIKRNIADSAQKVSEDIYKFQPTPEVRTFGQLIGHIANAQYMFCSAAKGETSPNTADIEKTATTKADLVKALSESFAYCDGVYGMMTDAVGMEKIKAGQSEVTKMSRLIFNVAHDNEHYGNLVTYMRLKGIVPPSTERAQQQTRPSGR